MDERGSLIAWVDENVDDSIILTGHRTLGLYTVDDWASHPAVFLLDEEGHHARSPRVALAGWALDPDAFDAVVAAGVDADYARAAHGAGVSDAWQLIEAWRSGIPVEFLSALGGAV